MKIIEKTYQIGDWVKSENGFRKRCPTCREEFTGRRNKTYCNPICKQRTNNDTAKVRNTKNKRVTTSILKNYNILETYHQLDKEITYVPFELLKQSGFIDSYFSGTVKDTDGIQWFKIGEFLYRRKDSKILIYKNK